MRKVTREAVSAFINGRAFKSGNTQVTVDGPKTTMRLHGNAIATICDGRLVISDGGWQTATTKERLNGLPGVSVHQKDYQWYLNGKQWDGEPTPVEW